VQIAITAGHGEAVEPFAADQPLLLADDVVFKQQVPANVVVKDQRQRPHPQLAGGAVDVAAYAGVSLQPHTAILHNRCLDRLRASRRGQRTRRTRLVSTTV
jgi:hypothetical protein